MKIITLSNVEFKDFVNAQKNCSFYQTEEYAIFMQENGFDYEYIGVKDSFGNVRAASLILFKSLDEKHNYGYAPRGFLIDYSDKDFVKDFAKSVNKFFKNKNMVFLKINPNIIICKYDKRKNIYMYNDNVKVIDYLIRNKFQELKKNKYFEALLPTYSPIINLKKFAYKNLDKNVRNKISKCYRKGLSIVKSDMSGLEQLYPFIKNKTKKSLEYYQNLYHAFEKSKSIDVFLIKVNFEEYLINTKDKYQKIYTENNELNERIREDKSTKTLKRKIQSDKELERLENDIIIATNGLSDNKNRFIAGAIVIKYKNKATIFVSGYDRKFKELNSNDFLYYKLIEYYKYNYDFLDLDGFSGDVTDTNPYIGLNKFKMGFNPEVYGDIGEFDIIFNDRVYQKIASNGTLAEIFNTMRQ